MGSSIIGALHIVRPLVRVSGLPRTGGASSQLTTHACLEECMVDGRGNAGIVILCALRVLPRTGGMHMLLIALMLSEHGEQLRAICRTAPRFVNQHAIQGRQAECTSIKVSKLQPQPPAEDANLRELPVRAAARPLDGDPPPSTVARLGSDDKAGLDSVECANMVL